MNFPDTIIMEIPVEVAAEVGRIAAYALRDRARADRAVIEWVERLQTEVTYALDARDGAPPFEVA